MSEPFIGEIRAWACNFAPRGWLECAGSVVPISEYQALYAVVGTAYGGDGRVNFGLPNLQGSAPMGWGAGPGLTPKTIGMRGGDEGATLSVAAMPNHDHALHGRQTPGSEKNPQNAYLAQDMVKAGPFTKATDIYGPATNLQKMEPQAIGVAGSSAAHENRQPFLVLRFCIAYDGIFPSRS
jgi:microcystin-dependent protein